MSSQPQFHGNSTQETTYEREQRHLDELIAMLDLHVRELQGQHQFPVAEAEIDRLQEQELAELQARHAAESARATIRVRWERSQASSPATDDEDGRRRREHSQAPPAAAFFGWGRDDLDILNSELLERREGEEAKFALGDRTNRQSGKNYRGTGLGGKENCPPR